MTALLKTCMEKFLSTPSVRRATYAEYTYNGDKQISIHALREEGDPGGNHSAVEPYHFYPRPP